MKKRYWVLASVTGVFLLLIGISYALWNAMFYQTDENLVTTDCFKITFEEESNSNILLNTSYPLSEKEGMSLKPYHFRIENVCNSIGNYDINMEIMENSTMPSNAIRAKLNDRASLLLTQEVNPSVGVSAYKMGSGVLKPNESHEYDLRIWMDENASVEASNKSFVGKVSVVVSYEKYYREEILNGADPVLKEGLIPVTIDSSGVVKKADTGSKWYSYQEKTWANAVILEDESVVYQNNEEIPENNIESYFVWIPRYRYQIFNEGNYEGLTSIEKKEQTIEVEFESKDKLSSNGSHVGEWLTHPAFTSFDVNGMWVGKFETGYKGATTTESAQQNIVDTEKVEIKPNVYSWRGIQVANAHLNSYNYKREYDSHMMKNTEWGAVAYLQHSVYGSQVSVRINNNSAYITGYAAKNEPTCGYTGKNEDCNVFESTSLGIDGINTYNYKNNASVVASTTGNYSGIYDMSGGSWEYVMGVMVDQSENPVSGRNDNHNSNFIGTLTNPADGTDKNKTTWTENDGGIPFPNTKYYDQYAYAEDDEHYNGRILGDATGEMGPFANLTYGTQTRQIGSWYQDEAWFVYYYIPWLVRGAYLDAGVYSGIFVFGSMDGHVGLGISFRMVLAIQ